MNTSVNYVRSCESWSRLLSPSLKCWLAPRACPATLFVRSLGPSSWSVWQHCGPVRCGPCTETVQWAPDEKLMEAPVHTPSAGRGPRLDRAARLTCTSLKVHVCVHVYDDWTRTRKFCSMNNNACDARPFTLSDVSLLMVLPCGRNVPRRSLNVFVIKCTLTWSLFIHPLFFLTYNNLLSVNWIKLDDEINWSIRCSWK